eukprot:35819_1
MSLIKKLENKIAVITGAAVGIGQAIAILFAEHGCQVIMLDILSCKNTLLKLKKININRNVNHIALKCDISNENCIKSCVKTLQIQYGINRINILVNNACKYVYQSILSATSLDWDTTLSINLKGHAMTIKYFVPLIINDGSGSIINMGSIHSFVGKPNAVTYSVCKAGIVQMTKNCAVDLGISKYRIRVNCVAPGSVNTFNGDEGSKTKYNNGHVSKQEWLKMCNKPGIIRRKATPKEIAKCVLFFATDDSAFCTGSVLCPDGGTSCL